MVFDLEWRVMKISKPTWHVWAISNLGRLGSYTVAIASVAFGTLVLSGIEPLVGKTHPFTTYIFATLFTAWYCGTGPAILSLVLGLIAAAYFFLYPFGSIEIHSPDAQFGALLYVVVGLSSIFFTESMRSANRRAHLNAEASLNNQKALEIESKIRARAQKENVFLLRRFVSVEEDLRSRISRELHDQCGQDVTALQLGLKFLKDSLGDRATPAITTRFHDLGAIIENLAREIHELAWELRPPSLDELGLRTAVESYVSIWSHRTRIAADFECRKLDTETTIPSEASTALYRVIQEALTNVAKHSRANRVSVIIEIRKDLVLVIVEDQGVGFNADSSFQNTGTRLPLGLLGMKERIESVGGSFEIESASGSGTTIYGRIPVNVNGDNDGQNNNRFS